MLFYSCINPGPNNVIRYCQGPVTPSQRSISHVSGTLEHTVVNSSYADYADFTNAISNRRYVDPFQGITVPPTSIYNFYITVSSTL